MSSAPHATAEMLAKAPLDWTWSVLVPIDPSRFYPKHGPIPATIGVREQSGPWDTVGQTRKLLLADGGHVIETITNVEPNHFFAYELTDFQKLFKRLVDHARAEWTYTEQPDGTLVHWTYTFYPHKRWGWAVALIVRLWWDPYMRQVLPEIVHEAERLAP
jgi:hypothetical protein